MHNVCHNTGAPQIRSWRRQLHAYDVEVAGAASGEHGSHDQAVTDSEGDGETGMQHVPLTSRFGRVSAAFCLIDMPYDSKQDNTHRQYASVASNNPSHTRRAIARPLTVFDTVQGFRRFFRVVDHGRLPDFERTVPETALSLWYQAWLCPRGLEAKASCLAAKVRSRVHSTGFLPRACNR